MKKASLIITALTATVTAIAIMIFSEKIWSVIVLLYVMLCYYTELFICVKFKKIYLKLIPFIYIVVGAVATLEHYNDATSFFPQLSLIFFGIPTLLGLVYIALAYLIARRYRN